MAKGNGGRSEGDGNGADLGFSDRVIDRRLDLPMSLCDKGIHEVWGPNGPAGLLRRLAQENELGHHAPLPLTNEELAQLVELYDDAPPRTLREVLVRELRNQRRLRPGRKARLNPIQRLEQDLLPLVYARAMRAAAWKRRRLLLIEKRKKRWQTSEPIPTQTNLAMRFVRIRLPSTRNLDDKTLANRLSALKDQSEKKKRRARAVTR